jgi:Protein of unknown function (DUF3788)
MQPNAFIGRAERPADADLIEVLGPAKELWDRLLADMTAQWNLKEHEWNSYSIKHGWSLRVKRGKRNIVYLVPAKGTFNVSFILGGKAVEAAHTRKLSARVVKLVDQGTKYPEGTGVRLEIKSDRDLAAVKSLTQLKLDY